MGKQPIRFCYCCGIFHLGKLRARFGQTSGQVRANFRLGSGKLRARFGQTSGQVRANFGLGLGKLRARFGQTSGQVRANLRLGSGKLRARFGQTSGQVRANFGQNVLTCHLTYRFTCYITFSHGLFLVTIGCPQQPLIELVIIGNLKLEEFFEVLYPLLLVDILRTLNVHQCLSLDTIGCPQQPLIQWVIIGNLKFQGYLESYTYYGWFIVLELQNSITVCPWLPLVIPSNH